MTKSAAVKVVTKASTTKKNVVPSNVKVDAKAGKGIKKDAIIRKVREVKEKIEKHYLSPEAFKKICDRVWAAAKAKLAKSGSKASFGDNYESPDDDERRLYIGSTRVLVAYRTYDREAGSVIGIKRKLCFNANRYGTVTYPEMRKTGAVGYNPETFKEAVFLGELFSDDSFGKVLSKAPKAKK
jgi:hypothetical protein